MTSPSKPSALSEFGAPQSSLPFAEADLLAVRLLPSEFARAVGVSKQCVSLWIKAEKVTLGADGRLNPQVAMRQLLRNGNPGRIRARLFRQAFADLADLRAEAARADDLTQRLAALEAQRVDDAVAADLDYEKMDHWLNEFCSRMANTGLAIRANVDSDAWRAYVDTTLSRVMDEDDDLDAMGALAAAGLEHAARFEQEEGEGADESEPFDMEGNS